MNIVQVANYVTPQSGGLRRTLLELAQRYVSLGHSCTLIIPGREESRRITSEGVELIVLRGIAVPMSGGYRALVRRRRLQRVLTELTPTSVELSDKTTLAWLPGWLHKQGVPTVLLSHERHDELLRAALPAWLPWRPVIRRWTRLAAADSAAIICASAYAAQPFEPWSARVRRIPLGVDLAMFRPAPANTATADSAPVPDGALRLVTIGRLAPEKRPEIAVEVVAELVRRGLPVHLDIVGDGPMLPGLRRAASGLPITFHGHVAERESVAQLVRNARVMLGPCPVETFGLALVEALASGIPIVVPDAGAAPELVNDGPLGTLIGMAVALEPPALADAVLAAASTRLTTQRAACRRYAERFSWDATAAAMLTTHRDVSVSPLMGGIVGDPQVLPNLARDLARPAHATRG